MKKITLYLLALIAVILPVMAVSTALTLGHGFAEISETGAWMYWLGCLIGSLFWLAELPILLALAWWKKLWADD